MALEEEIKKDSGFSSRWKWFSIVDKLGMNDITKYDEVYKQNYITALNYLSYHKELDEYKAAKSKSKIKLK